MRRDDEAAFDATDNYLGDLLDLDSETLVTHLINHMNSDEAYPLGTTKKAIATIRMLIENQGGDPDELIKIRRKELEAEESQANQ